MDYYKARGIKNLLIIDDDPLTSTLFSKILSEEELNLKSCLNVYEAFSILQKNSMDCVICDIKMPEIGGIEFLKKLKARDIFIEVVLMTAYPTEELKRLAVEFGACDFLIKPIHKDDLFGSLECAGIARLQKIKIMERGIYKNPK